MTAPLDLSSNDLFCPHCLYNLRGTSAEHCPECGHTIDRSILTSTTIPWAHRRTIGRFRAFIRTSRLAAFHPRELARNIAAPLRLDDALAYRRAVLLVGAVLVTAGAGFVWALGAKYGGMGLDNYIRPPLSVIVLGAAVWLALALCSGLPAIFFHKRRLEPEPQRRAVALSYYASAPQLLVVAVLALIPALVLILETVGVPEMVEVGTILGAWLLFAAALLLAWWRPISLLRRATGCTKARVCGNALVLTVLWLVSILLTVVLLPISAFYVMMVYLSLTL